MEDINLLKQENEKLNARLAKAVEVFKEQKANIENLTKENEKLKDQISRTPQEEIISTENWNKLVTEKENLQKQIEGYENERKSSEAYSADLNKQCDKYELKVQELEKNIESKDKAYKVLQDTYNEVFAENVKLKNELKENSSSKAESDSIAIASKEKIGELENEITNLKKTIDINTEETKKIVNDYENKITRLEEDNIKLGENSKLLEDANKEITKLKREYESLDKASKAIHNDNLTYKEKQAELENNVEKLKNDLAESNKMRDAYFEEVKDKNATIDKCDEEISRCDDEIKKLKEDIEKSKEIYNNLENQKLALENDLSKLETEHNQLKDKYLILENEKDAYSNSDDALKEIIDVINKYGYEASKDITPAKENVMKTRIGSDKEFGQNVGV